ncbi:hypothetical protein D3C72_1316900 [compost metagenome]
MVVWGTSVVLDRAVRIVHAGIVRLDGGCHGKGAGRGGDVPVVIVRLGGEAVGTICHIEEDFPGTIAGIGRCDGIFYGGAAIE